MVEERAFWELSSRLIPCSVCEEGNGAPSTDADPLQHPPPHHPRRMDVSARVAPEALVGRALRVYWELDDAWFLAEVIGESVG